jgi:hypothetical protein
MNKYEMAEAIFHGYNKLVGDCYESFYVEREWTNSPMPPPDEEALRTFIASATATWGKTPVPELDGMTPTAFFAGMEGPEEALTLLKQAARISDGILPEMFVAGLKPYDGSLREILDQLVQDQASTEEEDQLSLLLAVIEILGGWKDVQAADSLIRLIIQIADTCEIAAERARDALMAIGAPSAGMLLDVLQHMDIQGEAREHILLAMAQTGALDRQEAIYRLLKESFLMLKNRELGAACLGVYGDARAIPFLRGYAEKNLQELDRATFYEIKRAVEHLGGSMEGIDYPQ